MTKFGSALFDADFAIGAIHYDDHYLGDDRQNRMVLSVARKSESTLIPT